ncbi:MAG: carbohydrate deacetylase [Burkholderiales bacterium]
MNAAGARLIVNADDFGLSPAINRGIVAAHRDGIVTSASVMVNGPAFEHAVALAKENPALDIGVHLTLTGLGPITSPDTVSSLVDENLRFAPHALDFARRYARGSLVAAEVRTELDAQIRLARSHGLSISHLDSHQHVHALPGIARIVADLASAHAIRVIRYPCERLHAYMFKSLGSARRLAEQLALNAVCTLSALRRLGHPDRFVGFYFGGRLTQGNLETVLRNLPTRGTIELMCHPAEAEPDGPQRQWGYAGPAEGEALAAARIRELIHARGIELIGQRDL